MFHLDSSSIVPRSEAASETTASSQGTAVIVSTRGRPDIVDALVKQLNRQTRPPAQRKSGAQQSDRENPYRAVQHGPEFLRRLRGNVIALTDWARGRLRPERILEF